MESPYKGRTYKDKEPIFVLLTSVDFNCCQIAVGPAVNQQENNQLTNNN